MGSAVKELKYVLNSKVFLFVAWTHSRCFGSAFRARAAATVNARFTKRCSSCWRHEQCRRRSGTDTTTWLNGRRYQVFTWHLV